jgi:hypothetical protein
MPEREISKNPWDSSGKPGDGNVKGHVRLPSALTAALLAVSVVAGLSGCGSEPQPRVYSERAFKELAQPRTGMGGMAMGNLPPANASPVDIEVSWTLPDTWLRRDSANALRVGSFAIPDSAFAYMGEAGPEAVDVSVVQLAGEAGGAEANVARWMGQVGLIATGDDLKKFLEQAERLEIASGQEGFYVDFTGMLSGDLTQSKTIYGAIVGTKDYTVFVKAMGDRSRVVQAKADIRAFCKSLSIRKTST